MQGSIGCDGSIIHMTEFLQFLLDHGYVVIFCWVALDQAGLPLPTLPLLLAAGALAGTGELSLLGIFVVCMGFGNAHTVLEFRNVVGNCIRNTRTALEV